MKTNNLMFCNFCSKVGITNLASKFAFLPLFYLIPVLPLWATNMVQDTVVDNVDGQYTLVIEGFDWGPAAKKVVLDMDETLSEANYRDYRVTVTRSAPGVEMAEQESTGNIPVIYAYVSDLQGIRANVGNYVTLVLFVGPDHVLGSPIKYIRGNGRAAYQWIDYKLSITTATSNKVWNQETGRLIPLLDEFDLTGKFTHGGVTMGYGSYTPKPVDGKRPLIIWLHGGGEGGMDPSIPLIANKTINYASPEIQSYFGGAYILAPQSPTFWMQAESGAYTRGDVNDIYNDALMALIKSYVANNKQIDTNRIYIGGCSNGGYMSLKLILEHPDYFAAGYISALAYQNQYVSDKQLQKIKHLPIWFVHAKDDKTTEPEETVVPLVKRLVEAGGKNIHLSLYDNVVDISGFYGGNDYRFNGHWSWIYSHANHATLPIDGKQTTIMEWLAEQKK